MSLSPYHKAQPIENGLERSFFKRPRQVQQQLGCGNIDEWGCRVRTNSVESVNGKSLKGGRGNVSFIPGKPPTLHVLI